MATRRTATKKRYRVYVFNAWPVTSRTPHNAFYFDTFDEARTRYLKYLVDQVLESRFIGRVSLDEFVDDKYVTVFESFRMQA